jgi:hypothetical protein
MELAANIDKYLSFAEKQNLETLNSEIALDYKKIAIAKANKDICQAIINQYEYGGTSWPDDKTASYVKDTIKILGYPVESRWFGKGQWRVVIFTDRDAFAKMEADITNEVGGKVAQRNSDIEKYNLKYKNLVAADANASRGVAVSYATKMNEMNISTYKYGVIAAIAIIAFIVYKKFSK